MKISINKNDILWSYIGTIMSMGANVIMLPFLMYFLEGDMLGLWYVFASVGAIATLFDFGFAVTFARNITYCWSGARELKSEDVAFIENRELDFSLMKRVLATCKIIYGIIAGVALLFLLTIGTVYIIYVAKDIQSNVAVDAWVIYAVAVALNLYYGYYSSFLRGVGNVERANKNTVCARGIQIILMVVLLAMGAGIIGASVAYMTYGLVFRLLGKYYFYKYEGIREKLAKIQEKTSMEEVKRLLVVVWHNAWRDGMISMCDYCCNQASTILCSMYLSLEQTGMYSIGVQIASAIAQISATLYTTYQPELQSAYINKDTEKMKRTMSLIVMSFMYLHTAGTILVVTIGLPILRLIKPSAVVSVPVLIGLCVYQMILKYRNCYGSYFSCTNRICYLNAYTASAVMCVVFFFIAMGILDLGIGGIIAAQIISQLVYNAWHWSIKAHKELNLSVRELAVIGTKGCLKVIRR